MAPVVILIRHAQALHNVDDDWQIPDPVLTEKGIEQCKALSKKLQSEFRFTSDDCRIVASPLTRTLQTVQHGLNWLQEQKVPVEVRAEWQETTANPCDVGVETPILQQDWPEFDFSLVDPVYPQKTGLYSDSEEAFRERGKIAKQWLFDRQEKCIIVVTHSGFLRRLVVGPKYRNVEYRTYTLRRDEETGELDLQELGKDGKP
ncbi:phosphoglycerate mutase-like protein [Xylariomycetidae sp. FL2044]|nr:phosphoglycerate mutase-like protein [Xylariomycetidae sp. FL2044]